MMRMDSSGALATDSVPARCQQRLADCGIRPTAQRVRIASLLLSAPQHLSAEQILASLRSCGARVSKATVYNTLGLFAEHALVREVIVEPGKVFYDPNVSAHYHFYYVDSGDLIDIPASSLEISNLPELPPDTEIERVDVVIRVRRRSTH